MIVIINEQHTLLATQQELLAQIGAYECFMIGSEGMTKTEMLVVAEQLKTEVVVFASPVPLLLATVVATNQNTVYLFHNDHREKKEINGKIISVVAKTGWELIQVKG